MDRQGGCHGFVVSTFVQAMPSAAAHIPLFLLLLAFVIDQSRDAAMRGHESMNLITNLNVLQLLDGTLRIRPVDSLLKTIVG